MDVTFVLHDNGVPPRECRASVDPLPLKGDRVTFLPSYYIVGDTDHYWVVTDIEYRLSSDSTPTGPWREVRIHLIPVLSPIAERILYVDG